MDKDKKPREFLFDETDKELVGEYALNLERAESRARLAQAECSEARARLQAIIVSTCRRGGVGKRENARFDFNPDMTGVIEEIMPEVKEVKDLPPADIPEMKAVEGAKPSGVKGRLALMDKATSKAYNVEKEEQSSVDGVGVKSVDSAPSDAAAS